MVGIELPVLAMEHMYLLTEPMEEVAAFNRETGRELIGVIDFKGEIYTRQERDGILLGTYEKAAKPWSPLTTPWDFGHELLPPDLDRIAPSLEVGFRHFPALEKAGIKQVINGPFTFAPDGNPLVGPVQGLTNFWCACAVMAGFSQGGGVGLALANWMVEGDPGHDIFAWTWRATANGRRSDTPTPRCARTIRAASRSASPTRSCPPRARRDDAALRPDGARQLRGDGRQLGAGDATVVRALGGGGA
jgi:glycine/D-amino acid oxidase-like deaminating enzyme